MAITRGHAHAELLPAFVLGALDPEEQVDMEAHLKLGCEACRRDLEAWWPVAGALALLAAAVRPTASLRATVLAVTLQSDASGPS